MKPAPRETVSAAETWLSQFFEDLKKISDPVPRG